MKNLNTLTVVLIAGLILFTGINANAESTKDVEEKQNNSLTKGSWSLQFRIGENFTLSSFEGAVISAKRHLSNSSAIRAGLSVSNSTSEKDNKSSRSIESYNGYSSEDEGEQSSSSDYSSVGFDLKFIKYFSVKKKLSAYLGAGPIVGYGRRNRVFEVPREKSHALEDYRSTSWTYGAELIFGTEWFVANNISLMAEYSISAQHKSTTDTKTITINKVDGERWQTEVRESTDKTSGNTISGNSVKFGLSLYF